MIGHGAVEFLPGMDHAVADGEYLLFILDDSGLGVGQVLDDEVDAFFMVGNILFDDDFFLSPIIIQYRTFDADPFQQTFGQDQLLRPC